MTEPARAHSGGIETRVSELERIRKLGRLNTYTVATVPPAAAYKDCAVIVSNGAAGLSILAWSDGTNWLRCDTRAVIS